MLYDTVLSNGLVAFMCVDVMYLTLSRPLIKT